MLLWPADSALTQAGRSQLAAVQDRVAELWGVRAATSMEPRPCRDSRNCYERGIRRWVSAHRPMNVIRDSKKMRWCLHKPSLDWAAGWANNWVHNEQQIMLPQGRLQRKALPKELTGEVGCWMWIAERLWVLQKDVSSRTQYSDGLEEVASLGHRGLWAAAIHKVEEEPCTTVAHTCLHYSWRQALLFGNWFRAIREPSATQLP